MYQRNRAGRPLPHRDNFEPGLRSLILGGDLLADAFREFAHSQSPANLTALGAALAEFATVNDGFTTDAVRDIVRAHEFLEAEHKARRERLAQ